MLNSAEGISYRENPLDFFIMLARYKFAARLLNKRLDVLEVGCGHGLGSIFLSKFCRHLCATDADADLIDYCSKEYKDVENITFERLNILNPTEIKQLRYDAVVALDVVEHFERKDAEIFLNSVKFSLKSVGFSLIGTPNINSRRHASERRKATHLHEYDLASFRRLLERYFYHVFIFSMTDEMVSTGFPEMAWYFMALCFK